MFFSREKRLCASREIDKVLVENGLRCIDDVFEAGSPLQGALGRLGSRHHNRDVRRLTVKHGPAEIELYIKRQWRPTRYIPRPTDIRTGLWRSTPVSEWRGLHLLRRIGVNTAEPWGLFQGAFPDTRSAIVIRALPVSSSLDFLLRENADLFRDSRTLEMLSTSISMLITQMFSAGLTWRSATAKHIYPGKSNGSWMIWVLDCEGVHSNILLRDKQRCIRTLVNSVKEIDKEGRFTEKLCEDLKVIDLKE